MEVGAADPAEAEAAPEADAEARYSSTNLVKAIFSRSGDQAGSSLESPMCLRLSMSVSCFRSEPLAFMLEISR
jgi:hypothetical protein